MGKPVEFFRRVSTPYGMLKVLTEFELPFECGFCSARIAKKK